MRVQVGGGRREGGMGGCGRKEGERGRWGEEIGWRNKKRGGERCSEPKEPL